MLNKSLNYFFCFAFIVFAALQYNDPDPYIWIPIYLYAAVLCWQAAREMFYPKTYLFGVPIYIVYAVYLLIDKNGVFSWIGEHHAENLAHTMKAEQPWIEETREFFGLVLIIIVLTVNYYRLEKQIEKD